MDHHGKQITDKYYDETTMRTRQKQRLGPTSGDPWGVKEHHWNAGANEKQQVNPGGPPNRYAWQEPLEMLI